MENTPLKKSKKKLLGLIVLGIVGACILSILLDRVMGWYLQSSNYYEAFNPNLKLLFNTLEYTAQAQINSIGIRNAEIALPKPNGVYRILAVGDSFTFGWGVNVQDTWEKQLEKLFAAKGKKVEIINAGIPGLELDSYEQACLAYSQRVQADAIIVGFDSTDDINQRLEIYHNLEQETPFWNTLYPTFTRLPHKYISPVIDESYLQNHPNVIDETQAWQQEARSYEQKIPSILLNMDPSLRQPYWDGKINPAQFYYAAVDPKFYVHILDQKYFSEGMQLIGAKLLEFRQTCSGNKPVYVVNLPSSELVSKDYFVYKKQEGFAMDDKTVTFDMDASLSQEVTKAGFSYISALANFRSDGCPGCFYKYDGHPTPVGTKRIAQVLFDALQNRIK